MARSRRTEVEAGSEGEWQDGPELMIYHITYLHIGGQREYKIPTVFELSVILDTLINDPEVSSETIKINTEEK